MTFLFGQFTGRLYGGKVHGFKDVTVQFCGLRRVEGQAHQNKSVRKALNTQTDRTMTEVRLLGFWNWVVVAVDDTVQITNSDLGDL